MPARDPGAQPERTALAWQRTTLAATIALVLGVRHQLVVGSGTSGWAMTGIATAAWLCLLATTHSRLRQLEPAVPKPLSARRALLLCGLVVALAAAGAVLLAARSG